MKVEVKQSELAEASADLVVGRAVRGRHAAGGDRRRRRAPTTPRAASRSSRLLRPDGPRRSLVVGLGKREELDAERLRVAAALAAKEAGRLEASSLAWALPRDRRRRGRRRGAGHRHDPRRLPLRPLQVRATATTPPRLESLTLLGAGGARRRRRGGPRRRRGPEPRPRPAEHPRQRRHPQLPRRARRGDRRRLATRSAPRSSAATRSRRRGWAACSPSARAAPRSRG